MILILSCLLRKKKKTLKRTFDFSPFPAQAIQTENLFQEEILIIPLRVTENHLRILNKGALNIFAGFFVCLF